MSDERAIAAPDKEGTETTTLFKIYEDEDGVHTYVSDGVPASVIRDVLISHVLDILVKETAVTSAHMIKDTFASVGKSLREMQDLQMGKKLIGG